MRHPRMRHPSQKENTGILRQAQNDRGWTVVLWQASPPGSRAGWAGQKREGGALPYKKTPHPSRQVGTPSPLGEGFGTRDRREGRALPYKKPTRMAA